MTQKFKILKKCNVIKLLQLLLAELPVVVWVYSKNKIKMLLHYAEVIYIV